MVKTTETNKIPRPTNPDSSFLLASARLSYLLVKRSDHDGKGDLICQDQLNKHYFVSTSGLFFPGSIEIFGYEAAISLFFFPNT